MIKKNLNELFFKNKSHHLRSILFVLFSLTIVLINNRITLAQEKEVVKIKKSREQITVNGRKFYLHDVEKGQTLYAISREYGIPVNEITAANPEVTLGLKPGQSLKIPMKESRDINAALTPGDSLRFKFHKVEKGETLYSLSKRYNYSKEEIKIQNPALEEGLKIGMIIKIPLPENEIRTPLVPVIVPIEKKETPVFKDQYNIAILLPFYLGINDSLAAADDNQIYNKSSIALSFYNGALMAVDSMKRSGFKANIFVYDSGNDSLVTAGILNKPEIKEMDLIIGPLYLSGSEQVASFGKKHNITVIAPLIQQNKILFNNTHVLKAVPSQITQIEEIAKYIYLKFSKENILIVHNDNFKERGLVSSFKQKANQLNPDTVKEINYSKKGFPFVLGALSVHKKNIIILPSAEQAFVTEVIHQLHKVKDKYKIVIFGTENFLSFENIDPIYLQDLSVHISTPFFINYSDSIVERFNNLFFSIYKTDPDKFAFHGYDIALFNLLELKNNGTNFISSVDQRTFNGLQTGVNFIKTGMESGLENKFIFIIGMEDLRMVKKFPEE